MPIQNVRRGGALLQAAQRLSSHVISSASAAAAAAPAHKALTTIAPREGELAARAKKRNTQGRHRLDGR
jgi:hypothetical protein